MPWHWRARAGRTTAGDSAPSRSPRISRPSPPCGVTGRRCGMPWGISCVMRSTPCRAADDWCSRSGRGTAASSWSWRTPGRASARRSGGECSTRSARRALRRGWASGSPWSAARCRGAAAASTSARHGGRARGERVLPAQSGAAPAPRPGLTEAGAGPGEAARPAPVRQEPGSIPDPGAVPRPAARASILVLEDEEPVRAMLVQALTEAGHEVHAAPDGPLGLAKIELGSFDVVLTDLALPSARASPSRAPSSARARGPGSSSSRAGGTSSIPSGSASTVSTSCSSSRSAPSRRSPW